MEVRIGITQVAKELDVDLADDTDRAQLGKDVDAALAGESSVLWLTDRRGRRVGVPSAKVAYVEIGGTGDERKVGFGSS